MPSDIIMLRYSFPQIVLQEVPDEISLALSISGCPLKCRGCHSAFTWDQTFGDDLTDEVLHDLIKKHKHISCVLLYDGLHNVDRLIELFNIVKSYELKTALYTGLDSISPELEKVVDYLKVGPYIKELGNLQQPTTNQRMYYRGSDITYKFIRK